MAHSENEKILTTGCKINLGLAITGRRADGYHLIDSVFYPIPEPYDTLVLRQTDDKTVTVRTQTEGIDCQNNTLTRAWKIFAEATGIRLGITVELRKGIPWGAGLGGGSADAAVLLSYLAQRAGNTFDRNRLAELAVQVGADVPFFLGKSAMRVTGIGDVLAPCSPVLPGRELVLVIPNFPVSTPWAYKAFDELSSGRKDLTSSCEADKDSSLFRAVRGSLCNDLEPVVFARYPVLADIKRQLTEFGANAASMSGSGSSVYGLFADSKKAVQAATSLSTQWQVYHVRLDAGM